MIGIGRHVCARVCASVSLNRLRNMSHVVAEMRLEQKCVYVRDNLEMQYKYKLWPLAMRSNAAQMVPKTRRRRCWWKIPLTHTPPQKRAMKKANKCSNKTHGNRRLRILVAVVQFHCAACICASMESYDAFHCLELGVCSVSVCICANKTHINKIARTQSRRNGRKVSAQNTRYLLAWYSTYSLNYVGLAFYVATEQIRLGLLH